MVNAINVVVHVVLYASQFNKRKMAIMVELKIFYMVDIHIQEYVIFLYKMRTFYFVRGRLM